MAGLRRNMHSGRNRAGRENRSSTEINGRCVGPKGNGGPERGGGRGEDEVLRDHEREIGKRDEGNDSRKANGKQKDELKNVETK